jgi:DNA-binding NarL/FixJ family response regulator
VAQAENGQDALKLAEGLKPDVMILGLPLPDLGGVSILDELRASRPTMRVIVMMGREQVDSVVDAVAAGAAGFVSNRSTGEELREAVITAYAGGSAVAPWLARHLLEGRGERAAARALRGRELDVLRLVVQGMTDNEIGEELFLTPRAVKHHLTRIRAKTGLKRRSDLTRWAVEHLRTTS